LASQVAHHLNSLQSNEQNNLKGSSNPNVSNGSSGSNGSNGLRSKNGSNGSNISNGSKASRPWDKMKILNKKHPVSAILPPYTQRTKSRF
jgi:hypothetical protein